MNNEQRLSNYFIFYVATILFFGVGAITTLGIHWYQILSLPTWTPSEAFVAIIWCVLFFLSALSLCIFWDLPTRDNTFRITVLLYMANAALVLFWNYLFFGIHILSMSFAVAVLVAINVLVLILRTWKISRPTAWLLVPYLAWMLFATYFSYVVMTLNP